MKPILYTTFGATVAAGVFCANLAIAAPDPVAVADRLVGLLSSTQANVAYDNAIYNPADDIVMILNLNIKEPGSENVASLATLAIKGYDETNKEGFAADDITATGLEANIQGTQVFVASLKATGLEFPTLSFKSVESVEYKYSSMAITNAMLMLTPDSPPATIASITSTADFPKQGDFLTSSSEFQMADLNIPVSIITEPGIRAFFDASGYESINMGLDGAGSYDADTGDMDLQNLRITGTDMGSMTTSVKLGGILAEVLKDPSKIESLMATATISSFGFSFTNESIFEKGLAFGAQMSGTDPEQLKAQAPFVLGMGLSQINNQEFTKMVTEAVNAFLAEPKSLTIEVNPENAVPVAQLVGAAMSSPQIVPDLLGITVEANQ